MASSHGNEGSATTEDGTTVSIKNRYYGRAVLLDNPRAPEDMRNLEVGIIATSVSGSGFQPHPDAEYAMRSNVLRALADLMDSV